MSGKSLPRTSKLLRCPCCNRTYRREVDTRWYYREVNRTFGYPESECSECLATAEQIRSGQRDPRDPADQNREPR
jgi:hypothetical protein